MFKFLAFFLLVAVAANAQFMNSGSTNTGMNVMSTGSSVFQNDIQNVGDGAGYGGRLGGWGYPGYGAYPGWGGYGYGHAGYGYGHPGYGWY